MWDYKPTNITFWGHHLVALRAVTGKRPKALLGHFGQLLERQWAAAQVTVVTVSFPKSMVGATMWATANDS